LPAVAEGEGWERPSEAKQLPFSEANPAAGGVSGAKRLAVIDWQLEVTVNQ